MVMSDFRSARSRLIGRTGFGPDRRQALTSLTDALLVELFDGSGARELGCALLAVGGYGRAELAPESDIDVVLVHPAGVAQAEMAQVADRIWYPIWDTGLRLDHSVRTDAQARQLARQDVRVVLGLLDARTVAGDDSLTASLRSRVLGDWRATAARRLEELKAGVDQRIQAHGELAYLLEPDLKESYGGLRDLTVLRALAASWMAGPQQGPMGQAGATLLDVRDALHVTTGRATDRLVQQEQPQVARMLGYADADELLRAVCGAGRTIAHVSTVAWASVPARPARRSRLRPAWRAARRTPLAEGVVVQEGQVVLAADAHPDRDPELVLRTGAAAAQAGLQISVHTVDRLARESAPMPVPWPRGARGSLVSLLGAGRATLPVWEAFDQADLIARLIPGWEVVRSAPQRNPVHRFTVDRHLVETAVAASQHTREVARPDLLLVASLFHDIGKGRPGDHSEVGARLVTGLAAHLGFAEADGLILSHLVRHHLLLPDAATRRDIDDPAVIEDVARTVGTMQNLELLHWLSIADAQATGPAVWSPWKANLIDVLVSRVGTVLAGDEVCIEEALEVPDSWWSGTGVQVEIVRAGADLVVTAVTPDAVGLLSRCAGVLALNRLDVRDVVSRTHRGRAVIRWTVQPKFGEPPPVDQLAADLRRGIAGGIDLADRLGRRERDYQNSDEPRADPAVSLVPEASTRATVLEVRAHDQAGLLYRVTSALADAGVNVDSARATTFGSEVVDVFFLTESGTSLPAARAHEALTAVRAAVAG